MWSHYVALGDSLTVGIGDPVAGVESLNWVERLARAMQPKRCTNLAKRGQTSAQLLAGQLPQALALQPDVVSVLIGGNDAMLNEWSEEGFHSNYHAILSALKPTGATILTMTMADIEPCLLREYQQMMKLVLARIRRVNHIVRQVSAEFDALCIDLEEVPSLQKMSLISADNIHPNMLGYARIADEVIYQLENYWQFSTRHA
jgi:lysophospholipase L1-like esterase